MSKSDSKLVGYRWVVRCKKCGHATHGWHRIYEKARCLACETGDIYIEKTEPIYEIDSNPNDNFVGYAWVTLCKKCGHKTYGSHKIYFTNCHECGAGGEDVIIEQSKVPVYGDP